MLAHEFSETETPTNPIGPRPVSFGGKAQAARHTHLMLVGRPRLSARGFAWLGGRSYAEFDSASLQHMLTLERLSLG